MHLIERDKKYVWHPFTPQKDMATPIAVVKGKGSLLFDENGNSYIDAISSWWVTLHGHGHSYIAEKIYQQALQLEQVIFAGFTHEPAVALAEKLLQILPGDLSKIFYSDNGSTATEVALKMAIQYWWNNGAPTRNKILAFKNSYHGDTFGAMSVSDRSVFTLAFHELLFEVIFIDTPTTENIGDIKATIHQHANDIAAFIYEPLVQGAGGMKMYDAYLMNELLNTVKLNNIICIADEVMTGFGRTGKFFASEYMHKKPDIICMSKGLTGGTMALGATACNEKIYNAYLSDDKLKTFFHGHSFTANPIACSAALASMDLLLLSETVNAIEWITDENKKFIHQLENRFKNIKGRPYKNLRSLGTILAFEITDGKDEYLNNISSMITEKCLQQGVYMRPLGNTVYLMPPYCTTADELNKIYETILLLLKDWSN
ncbi:MAG TPA: adenosylmethionine--8-amino-7-oxononanoate transaminase [Panacibacter sp.]|nr:adenosylmethionine--8-amino-7-oxononanoate transaminase [Panacibacter sp.]